MPARSRWSVSQARGSRSGTESVNYATILSDGSGKLYSSHLKVIDHVMTDLQLEGVLPEYYPNGVSGEHFQHIMKALDAGGYKACYLREMVAAVQRQAKQEGFKKHWGKAITVGVRELLAQITRRKGLAAETPSGALPRTVVTQMCEEYEEAAQLIVMRMAE